MIMFIYKYILLINMPREILDKIADIVKKYDDFLLGEALKGLYREYDHLTSYLQEMSSIHPQNDYIRERLYRAIILASIQTGIYLCDLMTRIVDIVGEVKGDAREVIHLVGQYRSRLVDQVAKELSKT